MSMLVSALIAEITTETGDSDSTTQDKILVFIKDALRVLTRFVKERSIINRTTLSLTSGAQTVDISSLVDFREEYALWIEVNGRRNPIIRTSRDTFNIIYSSNSTGRPELYRIISNANTIEFERKADQAYTINLEYFGETSVITTGSTLSMRDDIIKIIKDLTFTKVYKDREEENKEANSNALAVAGIDKLNVDFHRQEDPDFITSDDDFVTNVFE